MTDFLSDMYKDNGDFFIHYIRDNVPQWKNWILYSKATEEERKAANLRQIAKAEILLDIESKDNLNKVVKDARFDFNNFSVWETGSRGYHISILVPKMTELTPEQREKIRLFYIRKYGCDESKKSEKTLIACEDRQHFKTGNIKKLIGGKIEGRNELPEEALTVLQKQENIIHWIPEKIDDTWLKTDPVLKYMEGNKIPDGTNRNQVLFKNIAIGLVQSGLTDAEIMGYYDSKLRDNLPGKNYNELGGWVSKARTGEITTYNKAEMNKWLEENKIPVAKYELKPEHSVSSLSDLIRKELPEIKYHIYPLLPEASIVLLGGKPSTFKSLWALLVGMSLVSGKDFLNQFNVHKNKKVLLYDLENGERTIYWRASYLKNGMEITDLDGFFIAYDFNREDIENEFEFAKNYDVIILDSYRRFLRGDENDSKITDAFYKNFSKPLKDLGKTIIIIHHFRKNRPEDMTDEDIQELFRGSSDLPAQVDVVYGLFKSGEKVSDDYKIVKFDVSCLKGKNRLGLPLRDYTFSVEKNDFRRETVIVFKQFGHINQNNDIIDIILRFLEAGGKKRYEIICAVAKEVRVSDPTIDRILEDMLKNDFIKKQKYGVYALSNPPDKVDKVINFEGNKDVSLSSLSSLSSSSKSSLSSTSSSLSNIKEGIDD